MSQKIQISNWQAMLLITATTLPTAILILPALITHSAGKGFWVSLIAGFAFGFLIIAITCKLASKFPNETIIEYAPRIVGKWPGKIICFMFIYYFYYMTSIVAREFGELISTAYFPYTSPWINIAMFTSLACYALYVGLESISRTNSIILVFLLVSICIIFLLSLKGVSLEAFLPFTDIHAGAVTFGFLSTTGWFSQIGIIIMLAPYIADKKKLFKISSVGFLITFIGVLAICISTIGMFGSTAAGREIFPTFSIVRAITLPSLRFLERLDVLFMIIWIDGIVFKFIIYFYVGAEAITKIFGLKSRFTIIIPSSVFIIAMSLTSWKNVTEIVDTLHFPAITVFINFFLTLLLLLFSLRLPKKGHRSQKNYPDNL